MTTRIVILLLLPSGPLLGKDLLWFDSSKRPLKLRIWSGRLRKVRLYRSMLAVTFSNLRLRLSSLIILLHRFMRQTGRKWIPDHQVLQVWRFCGGVRW